MQPSVRVPESSAGPAFPSTLLPSLYVSESPRATEMILDSPTASTWSLCSGKRLFDATNSFAILVLFALPMLAIGLCVMLSSRGPALFVQQRVGRGGRLFSIYKFRSMALPCDADAGPGLTVDGDNRITAVGRWLRKLKLDEFPQLYNVLRGDMSLVGPRPKLPRYEAIAHMPYRPGITGAATLAFRSEEEILSRVPSGQVDLFYDLHIKPVKARIDARYMNRATFFTDLRIIAATVLACAAPARIPAEFRDLLTPSAAAHSEPVAAVRASHTGESAPARIELPDAISLPACD
jgi:lipopolysaccharide/colanic/teichoic acid biosynthesis glycosyltransferase